MDNKKICPHCKTENPENAVFCKRCGALFRGEPEIKAPVEDNQNKKNIIIVAVCIVLLILAFVIFKAGSAGKTAATTEPSQTESTSTTVAPPETTTATTTTATTTAATTTTESTTALTLPTLPSTTKPTTTAPKQEDIQEICDEFNSLIGNLKNSSYDLSVHKTDEVKFELTSFSLPAPIRTINLFMANLIPKTDETYNFSDGVAAESASVLLASYIPPSSADGASVAAKNVKSAKKDSNGTITIEFKPDSSSYADGKTVLPPHVSTATDHLDFANFALGSVEISKAEIKYPGTTVTVEVDDEGDITKLTIHQPVEITCTGGVRTLVADVGLKIDPTTVYEVSYK